MTQAISWGNLPEHIWGEVARHLHGNDYEALLSVSHRLYLIIKEPPTTYTLSHEDSTLLFRELTWVQRRFPHITTVDLGQQAHWNVKIYPLIEKMASLKHLNFLKTTELDSEHIVSLVDHLPRLESFHIDSPEADEVALQAIASGLPRLRALSLEKNINPRAVARTLSAHPKLTCLSLASTPFTEDICESIKTLTRLQSLNLLKTNVTDTSLCAIFANTQNLRSITLGREDIDDPTITNATLRVLKEKHPALRELHLYRTAITEDALIKTLPKFPHLERLTLENHGEVDAIAAAIGVHNVELSSLNFTNSTFSNEGLLALISHALPLTELNLFGTQVDNEGVALILKHCLGVRKLNISATGATDDAFPLLQQFCDLEKLSVYFINFSWKHVADLSRTIRKVERDGDPNDPD